MIGAEAKLLVFLPAVAVAAVAAPPLSPSFDWWRLVLIGACAGGYTASAMHALDVVRTRKITNKASSALAFVLRWTVSVMLGVMGATGVDIYAHYKGWVFLGAYPCALIAALFALLAVPLYPHLLKRLRVEIDKSD